MATFPTLKTGAVAQYPLEYTLRRQTQTVLFLDGSSQRYRLSAGLRRWKICLARIDEQELNAVIDFVEEQEGSTFAFVDPISADTAAKCVISGSGLQVTAVSELHGEAVLVIEEVA